MSMKVYSTFSCERLKFYHIGKLYINKPESVLENERHEILWDFRIETDLQIQARRPNVVLINKKKKEFAIKWILVWFHGISTTVGYLTPNPFYTYILNIWLIFLNVTKHIFSNSSMVSLISNTNTQLKVKTVLFQTIQFSIFQKNPDFCKHKIEICSLLGGSYYKWWNEVPVV